MPELLFKGRLEELIFVESDEQSITRNFTVPANEVWLLWGVNATVTKGSTDTFANVQIGVQRQNSTSVALIYYETPSDNTVFINYPHTLAGATGKAYVNAYPLILFADDTLNFAASLTSPGSVSFTATFIIQRIVLPVGGGK